MSSHAGFYPHSDSARESGAHNQNLTLQGTGALGALETSQDASISDSRQGRSRKKSKGKRKGRQRHSSPLPPPPPGWKPRRDARGRGLEKAILQAREYQRDKLRREAAKREREKAKHGAAYSAPPSPTPESAEEDQTSFLETQMEQLSIPWNIEGYINGAERSNITEFQRLSGANITIESNWPPGALVDEPVLTIFGTADAFEEECFLLYEHLIFFMSSAGTPPPGCHSSSTLETDSQVFTVRALVATTEASIIAGDGHENIPQLQEETGAYISFSEAVPGAADRIVSVCGSVKGVVKAYFLVAFQLIHARPWRSCSSSPSSIALRVLVPHTLLYSVTGGDSVNIPVIQESSGAQLSIRKETLPQSLERLLEVNGSPDTIGRATERICECLLRDEQGERTVLDQPDAGGAPDKPPSNSGTDKRQRRSKVEEVYKRRGRDRSPLAPLPPGRKTQRHGERERGAEKSRRQTREYLLERRRREQLRESSKRESEEAERAARESSASSTQGPRPPQSPPLTTALRTEQLSIPSDTTRCIMDWLRTTISDIRQVSEAKTSIDTSGLREERPGRNSEGDWPRLLGAQNSKGG
ncbi:hypothetical protein BD311DRAFT_798027 [Dichomitus squalens]|uniref:K Homology domain-containing protein n=1 Tax=Dichomitus squalens TaxID=114155 RepID=A0A4Q9MHW6_9APHY|nr:hypothetical protein BD311DRAFT_798027 [Dichomitus squalens]